jgi:hypothetical protein
LNHSSSDTATKKWAQQHFGKIEKYIRERERWAVAPHPKTLQILRKDFYELADIFVRGNYGALDWEKSIHILQEKEQSASQKIIGRFLRILGLAIPVGIIVVMLVFPEFYRILGVPNSTISLIALSWLLLAIDANLNLGVVERLVDLAKAVKHL